MSLRARQNGGGKIRNAGGRGGGNGSPGGRGSGGGEVARTWNPADKTASVTLSNGNLTANVGNTNNGVRCTGTAIGTGKIYAEILLGTQSTNFGGIGVCTSAWDLNVSGSFGSTIILGQRIDGTWATSGGVNGSAYVAGDVVGLAYDCSTGILTMYKNNVANGTCTMTSLPKSVFLCCFQNWTVGTYLYTIRTTTAEFTYSPPTGYIAWGAA